MNVLLGFTRPRSDMRERAITWQPEDAPIEALVDVMKSLTPEIVGDRFSELIGRFDTEKGVLHDGEEIYTCNNYVVFAVDDLDQGYVAIEYEFFPDKGLVLSTHALLECIEAVRRAFHYRTPQYIQVDVLEIDLDEIPDLRDSLLWAQ